MTTDLPSSGLNGLRGLRTAPSLDGETASSLRRELAPRLGACEWFTIGIMAPSAGAALTALRQLEAAQGWSSLQPGDPAEGEPGPVFLKGNQRTGLFHLRREEGLGEGILITGHAASDPDAEDTWGPLPLDLFA